MSPCHGRRASTGSSEVQRGEAAHPSQWIRHREVVPGLDVDLDVPSQEPPRCTPLPVTSQFLVVLHLEGTARVVL